MPIALSTLILAENANEIKGFIRENDGIETITGTGERLSDRKANGEERPWNAHKNSSRKLHRLYDIARELDPSCISDSAYERLESCASYLLYKIPKEGMAKMRLKRADFCKTRLCEMCNWRKSLKLFSQMSQVTAKILETPETKNVRFIFVTFTLRNCSGNDLSKTIDGMNDAFAKLVNKNRKHEFANKFKRNLLGYMRAFEVTCSKENGDYHPHIHAIFAVKSTYFKDSNNYIEQKEWQEIWGAATCVDYTPIVQVQVVKKKGVAPAKNASKEEKQAAMAAAVAETAKYPVKTAKILDLKEQVAVPVIITLSKALYGKRLVTFGGLFAKVRKQLQLDDIESGDLINAEDDDKEKPDEVLRIMYQFNARIGCYIN